ncbi:hypothetical protein [Mangrovicoccus ximenensis]|uniref:hypothetical protein n=1 Tax=Mangrovicoccus ximenensis TaxID=1911570 RepID=UPI000D3B7848|nr:hypothetical protein [Mangrovicoccus ximenensis]
MTLYIAENDGAGDVIHVWVQDVPGHTARPVAERAAHVDMAEYADISGASRADIRAWLET